MRELHESVIIAQQPVKFIGDTSLMMVENDAVKYQFHI